MPWQEVPTLMLALVPKLIPDALDGEKRDQNLRRSRDKCPAWIRTLIELGTYVFAMNGGVKPPTFLVIEGAGASSYPLPSHTTADRSC
jgi:hypothetical protein